MTIMKIARMGHPVLAKPAQKVADPTAPEVLRLVEDMVETMLDAGGTGLAAPQVYVPLRIAVFFVAHDRAAVQEDEEEKRLEEEEESARHDGALQVPLTILINPEWEPLDQEMSSGVEGCLSVPGLMGQVPRYRRIAYRGTTPEGREIEREAEGFHARVVQHEFDHLEGILYPQRMTDLSSLIFTSEHGAHFNEQEALRRFH